MPNWCSVNMTFFGKKSELMTLNERLRTIQSSPSNMENNFGEGWLGDIVLDYGLDYDNTPCRGQITYFEDELQDLDDDTAHFELQYEHAWHPAAKMWEEIIPKYYPGLSFVYLAEEPGSSIYVNTDSENLFYTDKYVIDCYVPDDEKYETHYYESAEDVLKELSHLVGRTFTSIENGTKHIQDALKIEYPDNSFVQFNVFEYTQAA